MALAHPITEPHVLAVPPVLVAVLAAFLVLVISLTWPERQRDRAPESPDPETSSWAGSLSRSQIAARIVTVVALFVTIAAGRGGVDDELENLAPALVVGAAWPVLVLASVSLGPVWRWTDPWDGVARGVSRGEQVEQPHHVWPAVVVVIPWVWYLSAYRDPLDPRSVGTLLALYTVFTVAGALAVGRVRWLASAEPFGIVLSWMSRLPRRRLAEWHPPVGAEALLGVLAGGVLFGPVRRSELWSGPNSTDAASAYAVLGLVLSCAVVAGFLMAMGRAAGGLGSRAGVARAAVPAVAAIIVAVAMGRNRLSNSVQLLPGLLGDPFGEGWDLFGAAGAGPALAPLGTTALLISQLVVLLVGHLAGAVVLARRVAPDARLPAATAVALLATYSVVAVGAH
ncbi:MAG: hypothetical protein ACRDV1_07245 [Actinomycetes bacterium]